MGKFVVPNIFVAGTKAKAQEVNENFASIQNELEKKALKEGDENQTFYVANAIEDNQAITKSQTQSLINNIKNETVSQIGIDKLSLFAKSGNTDEDGNADLINSSGLQLSFLVGNDYPNLKGNIQDEEVEIKEIEPYNLNGFADGTYNLFVDKKGKISALANNIYIQPQKPNMILNDIWVNTSITPNTIKIYDGTNIINFEKLLIGEIKIENSQISSIKTKAYKSEEVSVVNQIKTSKVLETYINGNSGYRLWSDKWLENWGSFAIYDHNVTFLKSFRDTNYYVSAGIGIANVGGQDLKKYTNRFTVYSSMKTTFINGGWYACGYAE